MFLLAFDLIHDSSLHDHFSMYPESHPSDSNDPGSSAPRRISVLFFVPLGLLSFSANLIPIIEFLKLLHQSRPLALYSSPESDIIQIPLSQTSAVWLLHMPFQDLSDEYFHIHYEISDVVYIFHTKHLLPIQYKCHINFSDSKTHSGHNDQDEMLEFLHDQCLSSVCHEILL